MLLELIKERLTNVHKTLEVGGRLVFRSFCSLLFCLFEVLIVVPMALFVTKETLIKVSDKLQAIWEKLDLPNS